MYDVRARERKARTMVAVIGDYMARPLNGMSLLNVGGSTGIIDNYLADHFGSVCGIDIDEPAIRHAQKSYNKTNLRFLVGDALNLEFAPNTFDVVICSHIYEHVTDPQRMMDQIFRVLKPGGVCYFAAGNRLMLNEPHYNLPLLSALPRAIAHLYIRAAGKAKFYYEKHLTYWGLRRLTQRFELHDFTAEIVRRPKAYGVDYMIRPHTAKAAVAKLIVEYFRWLSPGYIWLLEKPEAEPRKLFTSG